MTEVEEYKKIIDEDFKIFTNNKRLIQLEKSWIRNISHKIMKTEKGFTHEDRKELRLELLKYLKTKVKKPINKNLILVDKKKQFNDYIKKRDKENEST